jgi:hypothetical protein
MRVEVPAGAAGWLVISNAYSPQWEARVDGRPVQLYPTNFSAMGLRLRPGAHSVELQLDRTSLWVGATISGVSLLLLLLLAVPVRRSIASRPSGRAGR